MHWWPNHSRVNWWRKSCPPPILDVKLAQRVWGSTEMAMVRMHARWVPRRARFAKMPQAKIRRLVFFLHVALFFVDRTPLGTSPPTRACIHLAQIIVNPCPVCAWRHRVLPPPSLAMMRPRPRFSWRCLIDVFSFFCATVPGASAGRLRAHGRMHACTHHRACGPALIQSVCLSLFLFVMRVLGRAPFLFV